MLNFFNAIVIGFVQGVSEFLPISSSGHLILIYQLFAISGDNFVLTIFLHLATLFSIIYVYRKDLIQLIKNPLCKTNKLLIIATIPTIIIAIIFKTLIEDSFNTNFILFGFIITAILLAFAEYLVERKDFLTNNDNLVTNTNILTGKTIVGKNMIIHTNPLLKEEGGITNIDINYWQAIVIGVAQGLACFPGISRSGTTISTALMLKCKKEDATTFSFLLSIPAILGSMILALIKVNSSSLTISVGSLITACLISFIVGILSIGFLMKVVKFKKLSYFSFYLLGLVFLVLFIKFVF